MKLLCFWLSLCVSWTSLAEEADLESLLGASGASSTGTTGVIPGMAKNIVAQFWLQQMSGKGLSSIHGEFLQHLNEERWVQAFIQLPEARSQLSKKLSKNDEQALEAWLLFRTGLRAYALQRFLQIEDPSEIHPTLLQAWMQELPGLDDAAWILSPKMMSKKWLEVLGPQLYARIQLASVVDKAHRRDWHEWESRLIAGSPESLLAAWFVALDQLGQGQTQEAAKRINMLLKLSEKNPKLLEPLGLSRDLMYLTAGRMLYQAGLLEPAIQYYDKVSTRSDEWLWSREEIAWAYLRLGRPEKALAKAWEQTQLNMSGWVKPESFLVNAVSALRVCDYPKVAESLDAFKKVFQPRYQSMRELADKGIEESLLTDVKKMYKSQFVLRLKEVGLLAHRLPLAFYKSSSLRRLLLGEEQVNREISLAGQLYTQSLSQGLVARFENIRQALTQEKDRINTQVKQHFKTMAEREVQFIKETLGRLHVVEAELLTHVKLKNRLLSNQGPDSRGLSPQTSADAKGAFIFKATQELWFDELGHYEFQVKDACRPKGEMQAKEQKKQVPEASVR